MVGGILKNSSPFIHLLFSGLIIVGSFLLFLFVASLLAVPIFDLTPEELITIIDDLSESENMEIMKYFQIWLSIGTFVVPAFVIACFINGKSLEYLKLNQRVNSLSIIIVILLMLVALPVINLLAKWNAEMDLPGFLDGLESRMREMEDKAGRLTETFLESKSFAQYIVNMIMIAVIPAIGEELLFRGVIQRILISWTKNSHIGIIIAALIFSAFHLQFYGFLPRLVLGVIFGYLLFWSRTMWLPILAHFINNGIAVTVYYIYSKEVVEQDVDALGTGKGAVLLIFISALFMGLIMWYIYRNEQSKVKTNQEVDREN